MKMTMNTIAEKVTLIEGQKINLSIAQVKEVLRCLKCVFEESAQTQKTIINYLDKTIIGIARKI